MIINMGKCFFEYFIISCISAGKCDSRICFFFRYEDNHRKQVEDITLEGIHFGRLNFFVSFLNI